MMVLPFGVSKFFYQGEDETVNRASVIESENRGNNLDGGG